MNDKIDKAVRNSMVDDFLSDQDKPKPPEKYVPRGSSYGQGQSSFDWSRGDSTSFDDDDKSDSYDNTYSQTGRSTQSYSRSSSVFSRNTTHQKPGPAGNAEAVNDLLKSVGIKNGKVYLRNDQLMSVVNLYMKEIGMFNDKAGVIWTSNGTKLLREAMKDLIGEIYFAGRRVIVGDDFEDEAVEDERFGVDDDGNVYNKETGEIVE